MAAVLVLSLLIGGQTPDVSRPPGTHVMYDDSGKGWTSPDPVKLLAYVRERNKQIAAGKVAQKGGADKSHPPVPRNYGVDTSKIPKVKAARRWGSPGAYGPDEVATPYRKLARLHLTAIGPDTDRVVASWRADPSFSALEDAMGDGLAVQAFEPDNPLVADVGLPDGGSPDVVIQTESGKVIYRAHSDPGASAIVGYLRERNDDYDPRRDPSGGGASGLGRVAFWGAVAVVAVLLIKGRPQ